jgi:hypothetical protein
MFSILTNMHLYSTYFFQKETVQIRKLEPEQLYANLYTVSKCVLLTPNL